MAFLRPLSHGTVLGKAPAASGSSSSSSSSSSTTSRPTPTMSLNDAIADYQKKNGASKDSFSALVPHLNSLGYNVSFATHGANGELRSDDAIVDDTGKVWDLLVDADGTNPTWYIGDKGTYDATRRVVGGDGTSQTFEEWQKAIGGTTPPGTTTAPGATAPPSRPTPGPSYTKAGMAYAAGQRSSKGKVVTGTAVPRGSTGSTGSTASASAAQSRVRQKSRNQGRSSTVLAGFGGGAPLTKPATVLGA